MTTHNIVTLKTQRLRLSLYPQDGGCALSLTYNKDGRNFDIFKPVTHDFSTTLDARDSACFPLFPFSNRITKGAFTYNGQDYKLAPNMEPEPHAIHGWAWQNRASISQQTDTQITINHEQTDPSYPFLFSAQQQWILSEDDRIEIKLSITNTGDTPMPFGMGIHPYFVRTAGVTINTGCEKVMMNDDNMEPQSIIDVPPSLDLNTPRKVQDLQMDNCFTGWNRQCEIHWPEYQLQMNISADEIFKNVVIFIPEGENFFCVEPVTNINDAFNNSLGYIDSGLKELHSGQTLSASVFLDFKTTDIE